MTQQTSARYSAVAIALHWATAAAVLAMIPMGFWMARAIKDPSSQTLAYQVFQLHKSIGLTILLLTVVRLAWRLLHRAPPLPESAPTWERWLARATHGAFYALLLLLPLSGWFYVSTGWMVSGDRPLAVATSWFGLLPAPHLPIAEAPVLVRRLAAFRALFSHQVLAWLTLALVALHIAAALKHQFRDRDGVLPSMVPWLKTPAHPTAADRNAWAPALCGAAVIALGVIAACLATRAPPASNLSAQATTQPAAARVSAIETPGRAAAWTVDKAASQISFAGVHAGSPFKGVVKDWTADIWFDPDDLEGSKVVVTLQTASIRTGDATQEGSLAEPEWFDIAAFPTAQFKASSFKAVGPGRYEAIGQLTVKDKAVPLTLPFSLSQDGARATARSKLRLDRTTLNLGMFSDPSAQWVSREIDLEVSVVAERR